MNTMFNKKLEYKFKLHHLPGVVHVDDFHQIPVGFNHEHAIWAVSTAAKQLIEAANRNGWSLVKDVDSDDSMTCCLVYHNHVQYRCYFEKNGYEIAMHATCYLESNTHSNTKQHFISTVFSCEDERVEHKNNSFESHWFKLNPTCIRFRDFVDSLRQHGYKV